MDGFSGSTFRGLPMPGMAFPAKTDRPVALGTDTWTEATTQGTMSPVINPLVIAMGSPAFMQTSAGMTYFSFERLVLRGRVAGAAMQSLQTLVAVTPHRPIDTSGLPMTAFSQAQHQKKIALGTTSTIDISLGWADVDSVRSVDDTTPMWFLQSVALSGIVTGADPQPVTVTWYVSFVGLQFYLLKEDQTVSVRDVIQMDPGSEAVAKKDDVTKNSPPDEGGSVKPTGVALLENVAEAASEMVEAAAPVVSAAAAMGFMDQPPDLSSVRKMVAMPGDHMGSANIPLVTKRPMPSETRESMVATMASQGTYEHDMDDLEALTQHPYIVHGGEGLSEGSTVTTIVDHTWGLGLPPNGKAFTWAGLGNDTHRGFIVEEVEICVTFVCSSLAGLVVGYNVSPWESPFDSTFDPNRHGGVLNLQGTSTFKVRVPGGLWKRGPRLTPSSVKSSGEVGDVMFSFQLMNLSMADATVAPTVDYYVEYCWKIQWLQPRVTPWLDVGAKPVTHFKKEAAAELPTKETKGRAWRSGSTDVAQGGGEQDCEEHGVALQPFPGGGFWDMGGTVLTGPRSKSLKTLMMQAYRTRGFPLSNSTLSPSPWQHDPWLLDVFVDVGATKQFVAKDVNSGSSYTARVWWLTILQSCYTYIRGPVNIALRRLDAKSNPYTGPLKADVQYGAPVTSANQYRENNVHASAPHMQDLDANFVLQLEQPYDGLLPFHYTDEQFTGSSISVAFRGLGAVPPQDIAFEALVSMNDAMVVQFPNPPASIHFTDPTL